MSRVRISDFITAGTIFQDTRKPLVDWFRAMYWLASRKNGASALSLQRILGLGSYKTAWTWLHKFRRAMVRPGRDRLTGRIEVDQTCLAGLEEGARGRQTDRKSLIAIAAQEDGPHRKDSHEVHPRPFGGEHDSLRRGFN